MEEMNHTTAHDNDNTPKKMTIARIKKTHQNIIQFQTSSHNREIVTHTHCLSISYFFFHTEQKTKMGARKLRVRSLNYVFLEQFFSLLSSIDTHRGHISYSLLQFHLNHLKIYSKITDSFEMFNDFSISFFFIHSFFFHSSGRVSS